MSNHHLADKDSGMDVFQRAVWYQNCPLSKVPFTPLVVGMSPLDMIPFTAILMSVAVEDILAFEWHLHMGIEHHKVTAGRSPRQWKGGCAPGVRESPSSRNGQGRKWQQRIGT